MRITFILITAATVGLLTPVCFGDNDSPGKAALAEGTKPAKPPRAKTVEITPEREAQAWQFVKENHADLVAVLTHLKKSGSDDYGRAIRDLIRTSERLSLYRSRDRERYELELEVWKTKSQVQLLAARFSMGGDRQLEAELRQSLERLYDLKLSAARRARATLQEKLEKADLQIDRLEKNRAQEIQKNFDELVRLQSDAPRKRKPATGKDPTKKPVKKSTRPPSENNPAKK